MTIVTRNDLAELVSLWCERDRRSALLPADDSIIDDSRSLRTLILELAHGGDGERELYSACAMLGRVIGVQGGSPTLASLTIDHAREVLAQANPRWVPHARAALAEGFVTALRERVEGELLGSWEYPRCAVPLPDHALAIAANHPSDDAEELSGWAARAAKAAALAGIRKVVVAGREPARTAVIDALRVVGVAVEVVPSAADGPVAAAASGRAADGPVAAAASGRAADRIPGPSTTPDPGRKRSSG
jgi:hypothetical protein